MSLNTFRKHHLFQLLKLYDSQSIPLDMFLSNYFRQNKAIGSKDRAFLAETIYALIRWKLLLDYLIGSAPSWEKRYEMLQNTDFASIQNKTEIPDHLRVSFPEFLFQAIENTYGKEKALQICFQSNFPAPTTIRVNPLKISREELYERWADLYEISKTERSPWGIVFHKKINFFELPEFKEGFFEVQDEGSQLLAQLVEAQPGQLIMDYCAGSGGKTLAFAPAMQQKGQIFLHDIRENILIESKKRLKRAGIQNAQSVFPNSPNLLKLKKKMDTILVDVPCSGTGTLRRNPDMKWKLSLETIQRLISEQRVIFEKALSFLKPGGKIVYTTCSILKEENFEQLEHFKKTYPVSCLEIFQSVPIYLHMDGFFGAVLKKL